MGGDKSPASVAVVLATGESRLLLQLRDDAKGIEYPGYWSLIGGWIEAGEDPLIAVRREIHEELQTLDGDCILLGPVVFLGSDDRQDRPWTEYVFYARILTPPDQVRINEGKTFALFAFDECQSLDKLAPHHMRYVDQYRSLIEPSFVAAQSRRSDDGGTLRMTDIQQYIGLSRYGLVKDYPALEAGDGFVVTTTKNPTAAIHTQAAAKFIALLEFANNVPRGNHYHLRKVEYMTVLRGKLRCSFMLPSEPAKTTDTILEAGQMMRILPGCVHTFTALDGDVLALEYSPQRYEASDVIVVS